MLLRVPLDRRPVSPTHGREEKKRRRPGRRTVSCRSGLFTASRSNPPGLFRLLVVTRFPRARPSADGWWRGGPTGRAHRSARRALVEVQESAGETGRRSSAPCSQPEVVGHPLEERSSLGVAAEQVEHGPGRSPSVPQRLSRSSSWSREISISSAMSRTRGQRGRLRRRRMLRERPAITWLSSCSVASRARPARVATARPRSSWREARALSPPTFLVRSLFVDGLVDVGALVLARAPRTPRSGPSRSRRVTRSRVVIKSRSAPSPC